MGMLPTATAAMSTLNRPVYNRFSSNGDETIMFHGCRSQANEDSIIQNGFQVSKCSSGGRNFGTWFAYNASYSNCGYVYVEPSGVRHMFICAVSETYVLLDRQDMRVVGQDC